MIENPILDNSIPILENLNSLLYNKLYKEKNKHN
jgi:hypothetical protein